MIVMMVAFFIARASARTSEQPQPYVPSRGQAQLRQPCAPLCFISDQPYAPSKAAQENRQS